MALARGYAIARHRRSSDKQQRPFSDFAASLADLGLSSLAYTSNTLFLLLWLKCLLLCYLPEILL